MVFFEQFRSRLDRLEADMSSLKLNKSRREELIDILGTEFQKVHARIDAIEQRMDKIENRMDKLEQRMDRIEQKMGKIEVRMDKIEHKLDLILEALAIKT